jgi:hypothetical protein
VLSVDKRIRWLIQVTSPGWRGQRHEVLVNNSDPWPFLNTRLAEALFPIAKPIIFVKKKILGVSWVFPSDIF